MEDKLKEILATILNVDLSEINYEFGTELTETALIAYILKKTRLLATVQTPLMRIDNSLDIANSISFLASEKSGYITGETIRINGSQVMI